jgi:capsular polysaccharide transport system permease protein
MAVNLTDITASFSRNGALLAPGAVDKVLHKSQLKARLIRRFLISLIVLPVLFAVLYYGLFAADRYVSEANIIVRSVSSRRMTGLEAIFQTFGISRAVDDANAVQNFMLSRDAVQALETRVPLRKIFSDSHADILSRFPRFWLPKNDSFERLYEYYLDRVTVVQDQSKGITTVRVVAFQPEDAKKIAEALMRLSEEMVNRMNVRAQKDTVESAQASVNSSVQDLITAQKNLAQYRNRELIIDPSKNSASVLDTITSLATENAQVLAQIQEMKKLTPNNPGISARIVRADSLKARIDAERDKLAGSDSGLATKIETYERLALLRDIAEKGLTNASASLETARQEARRQQIYVEEIVAPNLPDQSTEPERIRMIATYLVVCTMLSAVLWLLTAGAQEHTN